MYDDRISASGSTLWLQAIHAARAVFEEVRTGTEFVGLGEFGSTHPAEAAELAAAVVVLAANLDQASALIAQQHRLAVEALADAHRDGLSRIADAIASLAPPA
jgi:hypothetical protein